MAPRSQPLQGEALAEAEAKVTHSENLREERRHLGVQPRRGGDAEHPFPHPAWLSSTPPEPRHGERATLESSPTSSATNPVTRAGGGGMETPRTGTPRTGHPEMGLYLVVQVGEGLLLAI